MEISFAWHRGHHAPVSSLAVCVNPGSAFNCYWPTLSDSATQNEVSDLGHLQYTKFLNYPGNYNSAYTFQVRDTSGAHEILIYPTTVPRFGLVAGDPAIGITLVKNDR